MATIFKAVSAAMAYQSLKSYSDLSACRDIPYNQVPPYAKKTIARFVSNTNVIYANSIPALNHAWSGFSGSNYGHMLVIGGAAPTMKVNAGFKRVPSKGLRTYKEFKKLQESGSIVVSSRSVGSITVRDQPVVVGGKMMRILHAQIYDPAINAAREFLIDPCRNKVEPALRIEKGAYFCGDTYDFGVYRDNSIIGKYQRWDGAELSTLLTLYRNDVDSAISGINKAYMGLEPNGALMTGIVSELNEAVFDLATELAEVPSLVSMVYEACKKILLYYLETRKQVKLLKRSKQSAADLPGEIAKLWMTYRYGIQPIVYSINDALDYLESSGIIYRTVRRAEMQEVTLDIPGWEFTDPLQVLERAWGKGRLAASTLNGLGLNPIVTAWELLPLSFVIDWVLNIGDLLGALVPSIDYEERAFVRSTRCKQIIVGTHISSGTRVPFEIDLYDCTPFNPMDLIGLHFDPLINLKRTLDGLSLGWLMFVEDWRRKK